MTASALPWDPYQTQQHHHRSLVASSRASPLLRSLPPQIPGLCYPSRPSSEGHRHQTSWNPTISGETSASALTYSERSRPQLPATPSWSEALHLHLLGKSLTRRTLTPERPHPLLGLAHPRKATPRALDPPTGGLIADLHAEPPQERPNPSKRPQASLIPFPCSRRPRFPAPFCRPTRPLRVTCSL